MFGRRQPEFFREKKIDGLPWEGCVFFLKEISVIPLISESLGW